MDLLDLCETNDDCRNDFVCQSTSESTRVCKSHEGEEPEDSQTTPVESEEGSGGSEDAIKATDIEEDNGNIKSSCKTYFNVNGKCEEKEIKNKFSSAIFLGLEEPVTDRRKETKILKSAIKFLESYDRNDKYPVDNFSAEFWTGGHVKKSVEKQTRVWMWRSSQTEADVRLISQKDGQSLKPQENHCLSVNFQKQDIQNGNNAIEEVTDVWKASSCKDNKKFICELPGNVNFFCL